MGLNPWETSLCALEDRVWSSCDEDAQGQPKETGGLVTGLASGDPGVHPRHQGVVEHSFNPSFEEDQKFKLGIHKNLSMIMGELGGACL